MLKNKTFSILAIVAAFGIAGVTTTAAFYQTAVADRGGNPDDSALSGPACDKAIERHNTGTGSFNSQHNDRGLDFHNGCT
jgi:hypothetical protein